MSRSVSSPPRGPSPAASDHVAWPAWWWVGLLGMAIVAFLPALRGGFIWDDSGHVTRADLRAWDGLWRIWIPGQTQQYYPLLHTAFWLEYHIWGDHPFGYHAINLALHVTAAGLFAQILRRLLVPGAWLAAALFALHPVGVETVAWISEQKNTLSTVLYLAAALAYLRFDANRDQRFYVVAAALFVLALLAKTVTATLPAALLVVFWWQRGRLSWRRDICPLLPWFILGAGFGLFTAWFERKLIGAEGADFTLNVLERALLAGRAIWFYLGKLVWPHPLLFVYPRWQIDSTAAWQYVYPLALLVLGGGLIWWQRRQRGPLAAFLLFAGTLFPVLGFFNVYPFVYSFVADHFQYLASLSIFALVGAGIAKVLARIPPVAGKAGTAVLLLGLGALTWAQAENYRDEYTLYTVTLDENPGAWMAHNNIAMILADRGQLELANEHLLEALRLKPDFVQAENNLGANLNRLGRSHDAVPHLERALRQQPNYAEAHYNLGVAWMTLHRPAQGMEEFTAALRLAPDYALAHRGLGRALATSGRPAEALPHFERAVALAPGEPDAQIDLGFALLIAGRPSEAVPHLRDAVALRPDFPEGHNVLGRALAAAGRMDDAIAQFAAAVELNPQFTEARQNLAEARRLAGQIPGP